MPTTYQNSDTGPPVRLWQRVREGVFSRKLLDRLRGKKGTAECENSNEPRVVVTTRNLEEQQVGVCSSPGEVVPSLIRNETFSFLYNLTRRWAWQAVAFRCQTHPDEATLLEQDSNGDSILHWACFGSPPLFVVEAILKASPELIKVRNARGCLPLHTACLYRASSNIVRTLVRSYPESAGMPIRGVTDQSKSNPLHLLCDYGCQVDSIHAILETPDGALSTTEKDGIFHRTPLQILNERKNLTEFHAHLEELRKIRYRTHQPLENLDGDMAEIQLLMEGVKTMGFWEKAKVLALAEASKVPVTEDIPECTTYVHALLELRYCPPSIVEFATLMRPEDLLRRDCKGDLPLHLAATLASDAIITDLVGADENAARRCDAKGRLPLRIYLDRYPCTTWNRVMELLVQAHPLAIEYLDVDRRLYPRIWSHLTSKKHLTALFYSVQGNPSLFAH